MFIALHPAGTLRKSLREDQLVGEIDPAAQVPKINFSLDEAKERRADIPDLASIVNLNQFEEHAKYVLGDDSISWRYFSVSRCYITLPANNVAKTADPQSAADACTSKRTPVLGGT